MPWCCHRQSTDFCRQCEEACRKLLLSASSTSCSTSFFDHWCHNNTGPRPDFKPRGLLQQCPLWHLWSPPSSTPVGTERGSATHHWQEKVWSYYQHHTWRPPLAPSETTYQGPLIQWARWAPELHGAPKWLACNFFYCGITNKMYKKYTLLTFTGFTVTLV